jgi:hypothetical protein
MPTDIEGFVFGVRLPQNSTVLTTVGKEEISEPIERLTDLIQFIEAFAYHSQNLGSQRMPNTTATHHSCSPPSNGRRKLMSITFWRTKCASDSCQ